MSKRPAMTVSKMIRLYEVTYQMRQPRREYRVRITEKERKLLDACLDVIRKIEQAESAASDRGTK